MRAPRSSWGLLVAAVALGQQAPPEPVPLEGTVIHAITSVPIAHAHVLLTVPGPHPKNYGAVTNAEGKFSITGLVPGTYQASAERVGFFMPASPGGKTTVEVVLRAGDQRESLKLRLAPLGSISGRVLGAEGEPVEAAAVTVDIGQGDSGIRDTTDDKGRFQLLGLRPGRYRVKASIHAALATRPEVRTDNTVEVRHVPTWYAGATEYRSASRVEVGTGADVSGVEIRLARAPMVRVSGKVVGGPAESGRVMLALSRTSDTRTMSGILNKDGSFEVWNIDPGKYLLTANWTADNQRVQTSPVSIEVGAAHLDQVELRVVPPSDIAGRVVFEDEQARPQPGNNRAATVELRTVDPGAFTRPAISDVAEDGVIRWGGVNAVRYRVMLSWPTAYVKAVTLGAERVDGNVLNLRNGAAGEPLTVLVSSYFGSVTGTVSEVAGPVAGARIAMIRDDFVSVGDVTFTTTEADGTYKIDKVRPGAYRISVVEDNDNAPRAGNLDDYEDILAHIHVQAKEKVTQDLKRHAPVR